jgi:hypothetical protein
MRATMMIARTFCIIVLQLPLQDFYLALIIRLIAFAALTRLIYSGRTDKFLNAFTTCTRTAIQELVVDSLWLIVIQITGALKVAVTFAQHSWRALEWTK